MVRRHALAALLLAASGAALLAFARPAPSAAPFAGWEYRIVRGAGIDLAADPKTQDQQLGAAQNALNAAGAEGWELTAVAGQFAVLKRPR